VIVPSVFVRNGIVRSLLILLLASRVWADDVDSYWDFDHPQESEQRFRVQIGLAEESGDRATRGELMTQLARAVGMQGRLDGADEILTGLQAELPTLPPVVSIRYMLERGRLIQTQGQTQRAWRWYHSALLDAQKNHLDFFAIDAMHMLGLTDTGRAALDWNLKALDLAEHSSAPHVDDWVGSLCNNIGWLYHDLKDYPKSLAYLRRAQAWHEAHGSDRPLLVARWSVAKLLRLTGEPEKALPIQLDLERAWTKRGEEDGYVYQEIAENMMLLGQVQDAARYYGKAYATLSRDPWIAKRDAALLARLKQLSSLSADAGLTVQTTHTSK